MNNISFCFPFCRSTNVVDASPKSPVAPVAARAHHAAERVITSLGRGSFSGASSFTEVRTVESREIEEVRWQFRKSQPPQRNRCIQQTVTDEAVDTETGKRFFCNQRRRAFPLPPNKTVKQKEKSLPPHTPRVVGYKNPPPPSLMLSSIAE